MIFFRTPIFIFITFVFLASTITGVSLWYSNILKTKTSDAASFGIQPPYLQFVNLKPGEEASASIRILRGDNDSEQKVTARFDALENADWITTGPSETIVMKKGESFGTFSFKIKVPNDAYSESYKGKLYFAILSNAPSSGVGIGLGARADVDVSVVGGRDPSHKNARSVSESVLANNDLVERLQGMFVMRVEATGQIYYIYPQEKKLVYLSKPDDFLELVKNVGRGISNELLFKIPLDLNNLHGDDDDGDGLPNTWEVAIGTDAKKSDTDSDGFGDLDELRGNFSPFKKDTNIEYDKGITSSLAGFLLLQSEKNGQIWYVDPKTEKRVLIDDANNFLSIIKEYSLGISEENYQKLFK